MVATTFKVCRFCRKSFRPKSAKQVYCMYRCTTSHATASRVPKTPNAKIGTFKQCRNCKKVFTVEAPKQVFCGDECYLQQSRKALARPYTASRRDCVMCGKNFKPRKNAINPDYCSYRCDRKKAAQLALLSGVIIHVPGENKSHEQEANV